MWPHWIDNARVEPRPGGIISPVYDPATEEVLTEVRLDDTDNLERALASAQGAWAGWRATPILERTRIFFRYRQLLEEHRQELAESVSRENGKTLQDAFQEVGRGMEVVELAAGAPTLLKGEILTDVAHGVDTTLVRVPLGVAAGITPYNFPAMIPLWMMPLAIVAGNTFVLKPSERTPMTAMRLVELLSEAGLPDGVLNLVNGGKQIVDGLLSDGRVRAVSFVGSQPVAHYVYQTAARAGKRVQALGGAKNYHVVMPDADLDSTVEALVGSAYGAAGQRCLAASVVIAVDPIGDVLVERLKERGDELVLGRGLESSTEMGPLIRAEHRQRVLDFVAAGQAAGAELVRDGRQRLPEQGFFVGPTLFDRVQPDMTIAREEIFGPVLSVMRAPSLEAAVELANRSRFGNTASLYTRSGGAARYFRDHIEAGMLGINIGVAAPVAWFPFSGWKESFYGDLHATGRDGLEFYTEKRVITERWT
jgi:malonate-semialdehyde dehydrogenase (acetylating)/methylmalonate-semialdehyde dehydrogenase